MRGIFPGVFVIVIVFLAGYSPCYSADASVEVLYGKVKTVLAKKSISVFLLDSDGSILDIAGLDAQGNYKLDPTVMDNPTYKELVKLKVRFNNKKGVTKEVNISNNIDQFLDGKVKLGTQIFP